VSSSSRRARSDVLQQDVIRKLEHTETVCNRTILGN
jgi:hypothetical protein